MFYIVAGALAAISGLAAKAYHVEWIGIILLFFAAMRWAMPASYARDIPASLLMLFLAHPLPDRVSESLQAAIRAWSVTGTEWFLHCFNVRVWVDADMLRTGLVSLTVPDECGGMIAMTAAAMCALGMGFAFRFRLYETSALVIADIVQALGLNILRISAIIVNAPKHTSEWSREVLRDTSGLLLTAAVLLVLVEAFLLARVVSRRRKRMLAVALNIVEPPERGSIFHPMWHVLFMRGKIVVSAVLVLMIIAAVVLAVYKRRPGHRANMYSEVADALFVSDLPAAHRAVAAAKALAPSNALVRVQIARTHLTAREYEDALKELDGMSDAARTVRHTVLKSRALMGEGKLKDAKVLIDSLPADVGYMPDVAMVRAECAAVQDNVTVVVENIRRAAVSPLNGRRIAAMYPYLAARGQWQVILDCAKNVAPHLSASGKLASAHALLQTGNVSDMVRMIEEGMKQWPDDVRFLRYLAAAAVFNPGSECENAFVGGLNKHLNNLDSDDLAFYIEQCLNMGRPDLAWLVYNRLSELDPNDPSLFLAISQLGDLWLSAQGRLAGRSSIEGNKGGSSNGKYVARKEWPDVPVFCELTKGNSADVRKKYAALCIAESEKREKAGGLSPRMEIAYADALAISGQYDAAHKRLDGIAEKHPYQQREISFKHALFFAAEGKWDCVYEMMRSYSILSALPCLKADLLRIESLVRLNSYAFAAYVASETGISSPDSEVLSRMHSSIFSQGLLSTVENQRARLFALPPAEEACNSLCGDPLSVLDRDRETLMNLRAGDRYASPFFSGLAGLKAAWYREAGGGKTSDPVKWISVGRDPAEKAFLLYELACLLSQQGESGRADALVAEALKYAPGSESLRRLHVATVKYKGRALKDARKMCPTDPEIWLADIVYKDSQDPGKRDWAIEEIQKACKEAIFPVENMVRAGDFLLRRGQAEAAGIAACYAVTNSHGFLPAHVLELKCGLAERDWKRVASSAREAAGCANDPSPFQAILAKIEKMSGSVNDKMLADTLTQLIAGFPESARKLSQSGEEYLWHGGSRRIFDNMRRLRASGRDDVELRTSLINAEYERRSGRTGTAIEILKDTLARHPQNPVVLENLVLCMASGRATLPKAGELLPRLLETWGDSPVAHNTAAVVYKDLGDIKSAKQHLQKAIELLECHETERLRADTIAVVPGVFIGNSDYGVDRTIGELREHALDLVAPPAAKASGIIEKSE